MPLLKRKPFEVKPLPADLSDDKEYFVCKATGEVFDNYEEFFERVIVCNSLVWTCSITQRPGLTYSEAINYEQAALRTLKQFPKPLRKPVLYLAKLTHRTRINDLNDDVYTYIKDVYFKDELVEAIHEDEWWECKVLDSYLIEKEKPIKPKMNGNTGNDVVENEIINPEADDDEQAPDEPDWDNIRYKVRLWDDETDKFIAGDDGVITVDTTCIRRAKSTLNQEKCRLFLKYHCNPENMIWKVRPEYLRQYGIEDCVLANFISQREPEFPKSMLPQKRIGSKTKKSLESIERRLVEEKRRLERAKENEVKAQAKKEAKEKVHKTTPEERAAIRQAEKEARDKIRAEAMEKMKEERARLREVREQERLKVKEEKRIAMEKEREWMKVREDLLCDDLKPFPTPEYIPSQLSHNFGEIIMILEFISTFGEDLGLDEVFGDDIEITTLQSALFGSDINGPLAEIVAALLRSIFSCQDEEEAELIENPALLQDTDDMDLGTEPTYEELINSASMASQICQSTHGKHLKDTPLDCLTLTEVLRLHLLSSGAKESPASVKFRFQARGGYKSLDDAGIDLKKDHADIIKALSSDNVFDLSVKDKLIILSTLINQLLSYATLRDVLEERMESLRIRSYELKQFQWSEQRREREEAQIKQKKRLEAKLQQQATALAEFQEAAKKEGTESGENPAETEKSEAPKPEEDPAEKERAKEAKKLAKKLITETASLDPNKGHQDTGRTRRKPVTHVDETDWVEYDLTEWNSLEEKYLPEEEIETLKLRRQEIDTRKRQDFLEKEAEMISECLKLQKQAGTQSLGKDRWGRTYWTFGSIPGLFIEMDPTDVITSPHDLNSSISNSSEKENLPSNRDLLRVKQSEGVLHSSGSENSLTKIDSSASLLDLNAVYPHTNMEEDPSYSKETCWVYYTNYEDVLTVLNNRGMRESSLKQKITSELMKKYIQQNISNNTDFQIKEHSSDDTSAPRAASGTKIKSRYRIKKGLVENMSAQEQLELNLREMILDLEERIHVGGLGQLKISNRIKWREDIEAGSYSAQDSELSSMFTDDDEDLDVAGVVVHDLCRSLLQIQKSIEPKYLCVPLGEVQLEKTGKGKKKATSKPATTQDNTNSNQPAKTILERWQESLLSSTSLSQIFLHMTTLENSVLWTKSALNARCKICRKKGDGEKMLLCDSCDCGHHMYCLKPQVRNVPTGDWFCPECRPKQPRARRNMRKFSDYTEDISDEGGDSSKTNQSEEGDSDHPAGQSAYDEDTMTSSEEEITHPKIKVLKGRGKQRSRAATPDVERSRRSAAPSPELMPRRSRGSNNNSPQIDSSSNGPRKRRSRQPSPDTKGRGSFGARSNFSEEVAKMSQCEQIVREVMEEEDSWPFENPVDKREVPDYYEIIKHPMDFHTICNKVKMVKYTDVQEMIDDVRLIFSNCYKYNMEGCEVFKCGKKISKMFERKIKSFRLENNEPSSSKKARKH